jgi:general stress protein CsbA
MSLLNEYLALVVAVILILASLPVVYFLDPPG